MNVMISNAQMQTSSQQSSEPPGQAVRTGSHWNLVARRHSSCFCWRQEDVLERGFPWGRLWTSRGSVCLCQCNPPSRTDQSMAAGDVEGQWQALLPQQVSHTCPAFLTDSWNQELFHMSILGFEDITKVDPCMMLTSVRILQHEITWNRGLPWPSSS